MSMLAFVSRLTLPRFGRASINLWEKSPMRRDPVAYRPQIISLYKRFAMAFWSGYQTAC
jgi:hypothetical protein